MDVADIMLIIQWWATCKLTTLWQCFGRAVRNKELTGTALLFAEKDYFDDEQASKAARKAQREKTQKRKAKDAQLPTALHPMKCITSSSNEHVKSADLGLTSTPSALRGDGDSSDSSSGESDDKDELLGTAIHATASDGIDAAGREGLLEAMKHRVRGNGKEWKHRKRELDPGIEYLINANSRAGLMCRRKVFDVCFDNVAAGGKFTYDQA